MNNNLTKATENLLAIEDALELSPFVIDALANHFPAVASFFTSQRESILSHLRKVHSAIAEEAARQARQEEDRGPQE